MLTTRLAIPIAHGHLEALLESPPEPQAYAAVCHLHPLLGGNMHNNTTYRIAKAWTQANVSSLRFNFRGVGKSTGSYSDGLGELEDAQTALDFLEKQQPSLPLFASGFSFGARTALSLALSESRVERVLAVGVGVDFFDMRFVAGLRKPVAFVHAEQDEFGKLENLQALANQMQAPNKLFVVPGASHLFLNHMKGLEEQLARAVAWLVRGETV
jgi:alpha/beta superfamily hydrolase